MNISEVKDLMAQFDQSSLREFSFKTDESELTFSKNEHTAPVAPVTTAAPVSAPVEVAAAQAPQAAPAEVEVVADTDIFAEVKKYQARLLG